MIFDVFKNYRPATRFFRNPRDQTTIGMGIYMRTDKLGNVFPLTA